MLTSPSPDLSPSHSTNPSFPSQQCLPVPLSTQPLSLPAPTSIPVACCAHSHPTMPHPSPSPSVPTSPQSSVSAQGPLTPLLTLTPPVPLQTPAQSSQWPPILFQYITRAIPSASPATRPTPFQFPLPVPPPSTPPVPLASSSIPIPPYASPPIPRLPPGIPSQRPPIVPQPLPNQHLSPPYPSTPPVPHTSCRPTLCQLGGDMGRGEGSAGGRYLSPYPLQAPPLSPS